MNKLIFKALMTTAFAISGVDSVADSQASYFRVWEGFRRSDVSEQRFHQELPSFMADTLKLYGGQAALSNYIVVIPPREKPSFIPDELALVALTSETAYRRIRGTPEGIQYGEKHWELFDRATSHSAPQFIDYQQARPAKLVDGAAYDVIGNPIDWSSGFTVAFIGIRRDDLTPNDFLMRLQSHIELTYRQLVPQGLRGYLVTAHDHYEVAYLNWPSKAAHDQAAASEQSKVAFADATQIMTPLMYEAASPFAAGVPMEFNKVYSAVSTKPEPNGKVLIVVTSNERLGDTGKKTGFYLPEVTHPFFEFIDSGFQVDIASPAGGKAPVDERSVDLTDAKNRKFLETPDYVHKIENTLPITSLDALSYTAILFADGHGTMWDFPDSQAMQSLIASVYENGGIVSAVCHGPAALVNVRLSNGQSLLEGRRATAFTNDEEDAVGLTTTLPFLLETQMLKRGAHFEKAALWQPLVVSDGRLVTGQNPASAAGVGAEVVRLLKAR